MSFTFAKVVNHAIIPRRANRYDAGMDLSACEAAVVPARGQATIDTGIAVGVPKDSYARVAPRSGLAFKHSLDVLAGVVDCGYTNRIKVIMFNHGDVDYEVNVGDRIAQLIFERIYIPDQDAIDIVPYEDFLKSMSEDNQCNSRGLGGFGSTGK